MNAARMGGRIVTFCMMVKFFRERSTNGGVHG